MPSSVAASGAEPTGLLSAVDPWEAAGKGDVQQLQRWVGSGGKVDARRWQDGFTLLMLAANNNQLELIKWLIDHGADLRAEHATNGSTALWWAATQGHWGVMEVLIKAGLSHRHAVPETCTTALMAAAMHGHAALGRSLMGIARANPNAIEQVTGNTALHLAAWAGHALTVTTLVAYTDICTRNFMGYTALDIAREAGKASCVSTLEVAQRSEELWTVAAHGTAEQVLALLKGGASCEAVVLKAGQQIPLHSAARNGKTNNARALMAYGAKVDMKDVYGCTALHYAVAGRHARFVQMLLESGADVSISNNDGQIALDIARSFAKQEPFILAVLQGDVTAISAPIEPQVVDPPPTGAVDGDASSVKQEEEDAGVSDAALTPQPPPTASADHDTAASDDDENVERASADEDDVKKPSSSEIVSRGDDRASEKKRRSRGKKADSAAKAAKDRAKQEARAKQEEEEALRRAVEEARRAQEQQESMGEGGEGGGSGGGGKADRRRRMAQLKEQRERQKAMEEEQQKRRDARAQQQTTTMHAEQAIELGDADAVEVMIRLKGAAELAANYRKAQQLKEEEERKKEALDKSSGGKGKKDKKRLQGQKKVEQAHPQPLAELATKLLHPTADKLKANQELSPAEMRDLLHVIQRRLNEIQRWGMVEGIQAAQELLREYLRSLQRGREEERKQEKMTHARLLQELSQREGGLMGVYRDMQWMRRFRDLHDFPALFFAECADKDLGRRGALRLAEHIQALARLKELGFASQHELFPLLQLQHVRMQHRLHIEHLHTIIDWCRIAVVALRAGYSDQVSDLKAGRYMPEDMKRMLEVVEGNRTLLATFDDQTKRSLRRLKEATLSQVHSPFDDAQATELRRCKEAVAPQLRDVQALIEDEARMAGLHRPTNRGLLSALDWANEDWQWGLTHADRYGHTREHAHEHTGECAHGDDGESVHAHAHAHAHAHEHKCGHTHGGHEHGSAGEEGKAECGHEAVGSGLHEDRLLMGMDEGGGGGWRDGSTGEDHSQWSRGGYVYKGPCSGSSSSSSGFVDDDDEDVELIARLCDVYGLHGSVPMTGNRREETESVLQQLSRAIQDHPHVLHGLEPELQDLARWVVTHARQAAAEDSMEGLLHRDHDGPIVMSATDPQLRAFLQSEEFERIREKAGVGEWGMMQRGVGSTDSDDMHEFQHEPAAWMLQPGLTDDSDDNSMRAHGPMSPLQHPYSPIDHIASPSLAARAHGAMEMSPPLFSSPPARVDVFSDDVDGGDIGGDSDRAAVVSPVACTACDAAGEGIGKEG